MRVNWKDIVKPSKRNLKNISILLFQEQKKYFTYENQNYIDKMVIFFI